MTFITTHSNSNYYVLCDCEFSNRELKTKINDTCFALNIKFSYVNRNFNVFYFFLIRMK